VYICPICINALSLRETPSLLGLHNNALGLRDNSVTVMVLDYTHGLFIT
jgi:hypothetical protein